MTPISSVSNFSLQNESKQTSSKSFDYSLGNTLWIRVERGDFSPDLNELALHEKIPIEHRGLAMIAAAKKGNLDFIKHAFSKGGKIWRCHFEEALGFLQIERDKQAMNAYRFCMIDPIDTEETPSEYLQFYAQNTDGLTQQTFDLLIWEAAKQGNQEAFTQLQNRASPDSLLAAFWIAAKKGSLNIFQQILHPHPSSALLFHLPFIKTLSDIARENGQYKTASFLQNHLIQRLQFNQASVSSQQTLFRFITQTNLRLLREGNAILSDTVRTLEEKITQLKKTNTILKIVAFTSFIIAGFYAVYTEIRD